MSASPTAAPNVVPPIEGPTPGSEVVSRSSTQVSAATISAIAAGGVVLLAGAAYLSTRRVNDPSTSMDVTTDVV